MKIKFLGTAAFEGIPALFCSCEACKNAKKNGGKDIRTRTQAIIDDKLLIDFPADSMAHAMKYNIDFSLITSILITHSHSDHLFPSDLLIKSPIYSKTENNATLNIYTGLAGKNKIISACKSVKECELMTENGEIALHELKPFETFNAEGYEITPVPASHEEASSPFIFIISHNGKTMLYGNDTGSLYKNVLERLLSLDIKFDLISIDCTMGEDTEEYYGHCNIKNVLELEDILKKHNMMNKDCVKIITHFSHNHYISHKHFEDVLKGTGFIVAYDGLEVDF